MTKVGVLVRLKEGVLDPQGKTIEHSLSALGFEGIKGVRVGKLIELELEGDDPLSSHSETIRTMCEKLLANPVIEDFELVEE